LPPYYKILAQLERILIPYLPKGKSCRELLSLLHAYAIRRRLCIPLFNSVNPVIEKYLPTLTSKQAATLVYTNTFLNHHPNYLRPLIAQYFHTLNETQKLTVDDARFLCRTLWSLAILELLDIDRYLSVHDKLLRSIGVVSSEHRSQLTQVFTELTLQSERQSHSPENKDQVAKCIMEFNNQSEEAIISSKWLSHNEKDKITMSSATHKEIARILSKLGIVHENEKSLKNGYVVDIFIPYPNNDEDDAASKKGIVLEFDGPTHFEFYSNVSYSHSFCGFVANMLFFA